MHLHLKAYIFQNFEGEHLFAPKFQILGTKSAPA